MATKEGSDQQLEVLDQHTEREIRLLLKISDQAFRASEMLASTANQLGGGFQVDINARDTDAVVGHLEVSQEPGGNGTTRLVYIPLDTDYGFDYSIEIAPGRPARPQGKAGNAEISASLGTLFDDEGKFAHSKASGAVYVDRTVRPLQPEN